MMKLFSFATSPYGRKVMLMILELGLQDKVEFVKTPVFMDESYRKVNPLARIPALLPEEGAELLFDSIVICDYLDLTFGESRMIPKEGEARFKVMRLHALASGITDAALQLRIQTMRNEKADAPLPEDWHMERQRAAIYAGLDELEKSLDQLQGDVTLGVLGAASLLGYLDFRLGELNWRDGRGALAEWFEDFSKRPSMIETFPAD